MRMRERVFNAVLTSSVAVLLACGGNGEGSAGTSDDNPGEMTADGAGQLFTTMDDLQKGHMLRWDEVAFRIGAAVSPELRARVDSGHYTLGEYTEQYSYPYYWPDGTVEE